MSTNCNDEVENIISENIPQKDITFKYEVEHMYIDFSLAHFPPFLVHYCCVMSYVLCPKINYKQKLTLEINGWCHENHCIKRPSHL